MKSKTEGANGNENAKRSKSRGAKVGLRWGGGQQGGAEGRRGQVRTARRVRVPCIVVRTLAFTWNDMQSRFRADKRLDQACI